MITEERAESARQARAWEAPGPGSWSRDESHFAGTVPPYMQEIFAAPMMRGFRRGFREYGLMLEAIETVFVGHRPFGRASVVGAPKRRGASNGTPPRFLFKLLFALHPELRFRNRRAAEVFARRRWRQDHERGQRVYLPKLLNACRTLQAVEAAGLDDATLRVHLAAVGQLLDKAIEFHFTMVPATMVPVGDWLAHTTAWSGASPAETLQALKGSSTASVATMRLIDDVAAAVRETPGAPEIARGAGDPAARLDQLRASSPRVAAALDAYLGEHGMRLATGLTIADSTLLEMPHLLLKSIAAALEQGNERKPPSADDEEAAARLRERVPAGHRAEYDALLAEARVMYGFRDEHSGVALWAVGLLRRAVVEAGRRLADRGAVEAPEHILEAKPAEVDALLGAPGAAPTARELANRAEERHRIELAEMPLVLGDPPGARPPANLFPAPTARMMRAAMTFSSLMEDDNHEPSAGGTGPLTGLGVSPGRYTGRARVVRGPADFEKVAQGDVLIARTTSPAYNILLPLIGAVVTDRGGALSHAAVVAREFGIPAVVGTNDATSLIPDGSRVLVDGERGTVEVLA